VSHLGHRSKHGSEHFAEHNGRSVVGFLEPHQGMMQVEASYLNEGRSY
jgi:hypothetical protein